MTGVPRTDPNYPPYGRVDGRSPEAVGAQSFEVPPRPELDVISGNKDFNRRERRTNRQETAFDGQHDAGYPGHDDEPTAAHQVGSFAEKTRFGGDPEGNYGVTPPDDDRTATPQVTQ